MERRRYIRVPKVGRFLRPVGSEFVVVEAASGALLLGATAAALAWANSPWSGGYVNVWTTRIGHLDLREWVNDGLMTVFFFVVSLEIKREVVRGQLRDRRAAALPVLAAFGGMVAPALVYVAVAGTGDKGWGVPIATDIAFATGVLALAGSRAPKGLGVFLTSLAIVDDIGAILVIALFYSHAIDPAWLAVAAGLVLAVVALRAVGAWHPVLFVPLGVALWAATHASGIEATIAGVALGLLTPADERHGRRPLERVERALHPWSSFAIVPLFALANAGVSLSGGAVSQAFGRTATWGIVAGLLVGKFVGVVGSSLVTVRLGWARMPERMTVRHLLVAGSLAGIGFTVSLFVAGLAFEDAHALAGAKIAILVASATAGLLAALQLSRLRRGSMRIVALVDDLMDRSRISGAIGDVEFTRGVATTSDADVVIIDLAGYAPAVSAVRAESPATRIVAFGRHTARGALDAAKSDGADTVLARSAFFRDPLAAIR